MKRKQLFSLTAGLAVLAMSGAAVAEDHIVVQKDKAFNVANLNIKVGDTVYFENHDPNIHNIYSRSEGNEFDSGSQDPGETASFKFDNAGRVRVRCAIHPKMKLTITVTQ